ncbi:MAG: acyltransferase [Opitutaceae bacterium]|nr:acyltransferase [Opitutaceae bacterium]
MMKHTYYPALDGVRTIAVGIVLCAHGGVSWFRSGGVGVDIFFVLSGFLITTILSNERQRTGSIRFRNFYARRFLRLAPALVLTCVLVAVAKAALGESFPSVDIALALTYTSNWARAFYNYQLTWLDHCWSLAIEEQFYLIWPLIVLAVERIARSPAAKAGLLIGGAAVIASYRAWHVGIWPDERINFGLDTRMDSLMAGASLSYLVKALPGGRFPEGFSKWIGRLGAPAALLTLGVIPRIVTWYSPWMGWIGYVLVAGLAAIVLSDLIAGRHSLLAHPLASRPIVYIGKISYGIYLLHLPVYYIVEKFIPEAPLIVRFGWKVGVSLALASASYFWIERRFLRLKSRFE